MTRAWLAVGVLAGSWLWGLGYFGPARLAAWAVAVLAGAVLLRGTPLRWPSRRAMFVAVLLLLPSVGVLPLPYRAIPLLLLFGLLMQLLPVPRGWLRQVGQGAAAAALVLLVQALGLWAYMLVTARSHDLPWPLPAWLGFIPRLWGLDAAGDGATIVLRAGTEVFRFAATWELLLDPATVCFVLGGAVVLAVRYGQTVPVSDRWRAWGRRVLLLAGLAAAWVPLRVAILLSLILHRAVRTDPLSVPNVADLLVNQGLHIGLLGGAVFLAARFIRPPGVPDDAAAPEERSDPAPDAIGAQLFAAAGLVLLGVALMVGVCCWDPVGARKGGRIMVVERHSTWEPTTEPYGTKVYGEKGSYNYAAVYAYLGQYYQMSQLLESEPIDADTLGRCDVLVIKTPTARYTADEVAAVVQFVAAGGSLLLIGDHTNVFDMSTCLNDIARHFGFTFRNDLLFRVGTPYKQRYRTALVPHPIVQHVRQLDFAVSCSIDPGSSPGRMAIRSVGLYNLPPAYQESNYHPQAEYRSYMQYGAWCQMWSTCYGRGRVVAFADSTLFSNFCTFQPGKAELLRGMLEWLNHGSLFDRRAFKYLLGIPWGLAGLLAGGAGLGYGRRVRGAWAALVAAGLAGWAVGAVTVIGVQRWALPVPPVHTALRHVVIDRTLSEVKLHTGAFSDGKEGEGYGLFEEWIPRVGNYLSRGVDEDAFAGDALVIICPTRSVPQWYVDRLVQYVEAGGRVLVVDAPGVEGTTANSLLWPFGLESTRTLESAAEGKLKWRELNEIPWDASCEITGGEPLASWEGHTVAARARYGRGMVTVVGFGDLLHDAPMGFHWLPEPAAETLQRYEVVYAILRTAFGQDP